MHNEFFCSPRTAAVAHRAIDSDYDIADRSAARDKFRHAGSSTSDDLRFYFGDRNGNGPQVGQMLT